MAKKPKFGKWKFLKATPPPKNPVEPLPWFPDFGDLTEVPEFKYIAVDPPTASSFVLAQYKKMLDADPIAKTLSDHTANVSFHVKTTWDHASSEQIVHDILKAKKAFQGKSYSQVIMDEVWGVSKHQPKRIDDRPDTESEVWDE